MKNKNQLVTGFVRGFVLVLALLSGPGLIGQGIGGDDDLDIPTTTSTSTCAGVAATVTASDGGADVHEYKWYTAITGGSYVDSGASLTRTVSVTTTYWVESVSASGNSSPERAPATITVNPLVNATVHSSSNLTVCVNSAATINVNGGTSYKWYSSASATSVIPGSPTGAGSSSYSPTVTAASTDFYVAALNAEGCEEPAASRTKVTVTTQNPVTMPILSQSDGSCVGGNSFELKLSGYQSDVTYELYKDGDDEELNISYAVSGSELTWPLSQTGQYYVIASRSGGCGGTQTTPNLQISHYAVPNAPSLDNSITTTLEGCTGTSISLGVTGGSSYRWVEVSTGNDIEDGQGNVITSNQISVVLTRGPTDYRVYAKNDNECESDDYLTITVEGVDLPGKPTVVNPDDLSLCENTEVSVEVSGADSYNWFGLPAGATFNADKSVATFIAEAGVHTYEVEGVNRLGCEGPQKRSFTVTTAPKVIKPLIELSTNSCEGVNEFVITLTNKQAGVSYEIFKDGNDQELDIDPRLENGDLMWDLTSAGTYHVEGTSTGVCQDWDESADLVIVPYTRPGAPELNTSISTTLEGCTGTSIPLAVTGSSSYRWVNASSGNDIEDNQGNAITTNQISVDLASGPADYHVYAVNANGCQSNTYLTITVEGVDLPGQPTIVNSNDLSVCENTEISLEVSGADSYNWYGLPAGATFNADKSIATFTAASGSNDYEVEGVNRLGCEGAQRRSFTVVTGSPVVKPIIELTDSSCEGVNDFEITLTNYENWANYKIYKDGDDTALTITPREDGGNLIWDVTSEGIYTVEAIGTGACVSAEFSDDLQVSSYATPPTPLLNMSSQASVLENCVGSTVTIAVVGGGSDVEKYRWLNVQTDISTVKIVTDPDGDRFSFTVTSGTSDYKVFAINSHGCESELGLDVTVEGYDLPETPAFASAVDICHDATSATLTLTEITGGGYYAVYDVAAGGSPVDTDVAALLVPVSSENRVVYIEKISENGCPSPGRTQVSISKYIEPTPYELDEPDQTRFCETAQLTLANSEPDVSYTLFRGEEAVETLPGTGGELTWNGIDEGGTFSVTASIGGCTSIEMLNEVTIEVEQINVYATSGGGTVCSLYGGQIGINGSQDGVEYLLKKDGEIDFDSRKIGDGSRLVWTGIRESATYVVVVDGPACGYIDMSYPQELIVKPSPIGPVVEDKVVYQSGASATLAVETPETGVVYNWYNLAGEVLHTGNNYTVTDITSTVCVLVEAAFDGCTSERVKANIVFTLAAPPAPESIDFIEPCGQEYLRATGDIPEGVTWYWQGQNANGKDMALDASRYDFRLLKSGTHYLRAYDNVNQVWGPEVTSHNVTLTVADRNTPVDCDEVRTVEARATPAAYDANQVFNRVQTYTPLKPYQNIDDVLNADNKTTVQLSTQFFDGLGRPIQVVNRAGSPAEKDIVQIISYDEHGRQAYQYLPFTSTESDGSIKIDPYGDQHKFYRGDTDENIQGQFPDQNVFYGRTVFEESPLNRNRLVTSAGDSWEGSGVGSETRYELNTENDGVRIWKLDNNGVPVSAVDDIYGTGELRVMVTMDEEGRLTKEYTDKSGNTILRKVQLADNPGEGHQDWLNTYYVYNEFEDLVFIYSPKAIVELEERNWNVYGAMQLLDELSFQYNYDNRGRMISKEVPGGSREDMVFDKVDRLIATQNGNQRNSSDPHWIFTKYDRLNRPVVVGAYHGSENREELQTLLSGNAFSSSIIAEIPESPEIFEGVSLKLGRHESGITAYKARQRIEVLPGFNSGNDEVEFSLNENLSIDNKDGYNDGTFPTDAPNVELYEVIYYDDYRFTQKDFDESFPVFSVTENSVAPVSYSYPKGQRTGSRKIILGTDQWLENALFYDDRGRIIQKREGNQHGGEKIETRQFDLSGRLLQTYTESTNPEAGEKNEVLKKYEYDHAGRLKLSQHELNNSGNLKTVGTYTYDELGQMKSRTVGDNLENLDYTYNIKGWMTGINANQLSHDAIMNENFFAMELSYDRGFERQDRSGNIMGVRWKTSTRPEMLAYGYDYDKAGRITKADFSQGQAWTNQMADYSVGNIHYDVNGNLLSITRQGMIGGVKTQIDKLNYTYTESSPNQLLKVVDIGVLDEANPSIVIQEPSNEGFANRNGEDNDYLYDSNGNLISDDNKGIASISYNYMNLPEHVVMDTHEDITKTVTFVYDANGNKLSEITNDNGEITKIDYTDGFTYQNDELKMLSHDEGRVRKTQDGFVYDYYLKDHLGKTRVTLTEAHTEYIYLATMETDIDPVEEVDLEAYEKQLFLNMDASRVVYDNANYTVNLDIDANEVSMLNGTVADRRIGPGKVINVFPGDEVEIEVFAYYEGDLSGPSTAVNPVDMATAAAMAFGGTLSGTLEEQFVYEGFNTNSLAIAVGNGNLSADNPRAYLNYVLFDDNFDFVDAGFVQVTDQAKGNKERLKLNRAVVTGGYLYVYVSNETDESFEVYFDDLRIKHKKGIIVSESHYYPFGKSIKGLSYTDSGLEGVPESDKLGLGWSDLGFRNFDPALARFFSVDPRAEFTPDLSTYHYAGNSPVNNVDYLGLFGVPSLIGIGNMLQGLEDFWDFGLPTNVDGVVVTPDSTEEEETDPEEDESENSRSGSLAFRFLQAYVNKFIPTQEGQDLIDELEKGAIDYVPKTYREEWYRRQWQAGERAINPHGYKGEKLYRYLKNARVKSDQTSRPNTIVPQLAKIEKKNADDQKNSSGLSAADRHINKKVGESQEQNGMIITQGSTSLRERSSDNLPEKPEDTPPEESQIDENYDGEADDEIELMDVIVGLNPVAFMQGFLGRLVEDLRGLYELEQYLEASSPLSHATCYAGSAMENTPYCQNIFRLRLEMLELTIFLNQLYRDQVFRDYLFEQIIKGLDEYMEEIDDLSWEGQVKRGELGYDILMTWLPPEKFLKMLKTMKLGTALVKITKAMPGSLKTTLSKLEKKGIHARPTSVEGVHILTNKDGKDVAKITTKGDGHDVEIEITDETIKSKLTGNNLDELNKAVSKNDDLLAAIANDTDGSLTGAFDNAVNAGVSEKLRNNPDVLGKTKGFTCN